MHNIGMAALGKYPLQNLNSLWSSLLKYADWWVGNGGLVLSYVLWHPALVFPWLVGGAQ